MRGIESLVVSKATLDRWQPFAFAHYSTTALKMAVERNHVYVEPFFFPAPIYATDNPSCTVQYCTVKQSIRLLGRSFKWSDCEPESLQLAGPCWFQKFASARKSDCLDTRLAQLYSPGWTLVPVHTFISWSMQ